MFLFGAVIGSFLGVCIHRLPRGQSVVRPGSHCPKCKAMLGPSELVPVLSYMLLRGRCRHCGEKISFFYPAIEVGVGFIFLLIVVGRGVTVGILSYLVLASLVVVAAGIDLNHGVIPDRLTLPWMAVGVAAGALWGLHEVAMRAIGLVACGGLVFLIALLSRGGMGGGDVKLMALVGSFLGPWGGLASFMIACFIGAAVGIGLIVAGLKKRKDEIPFGPFIAAGAIIVCISGTWVLRLVFPWLGQVGF
ncbi:MAG TPA: prepilin peptidase [Firmicutes bacterium]|nr:prepilin peptidase [Bacillota bacterium]